MYKYLYMYLYLYLYLYEADRGSKVTLQLADSTFSVVPPLPWNRHHRSNGDCLEGIRGKIIRSVLCDIVYNSCAQCNARKYEQT